MSGPQDGLAGTGEADAADVKAGCASCECIKLVSNSRQTVESCQVHVLRCAVGDGEELTLKVQLTDLK
jgi:hypothetical protein